MQTMKDRAFKAPKKPMATKLSPVRWYHRVLLLVAVLTILCGESACDKIMPAW